MWYPCDQVEELDLDLPDNLGIKINFLKIRKTNFNEHISVEPWKDYWSR